jgi:hypothetical protein
VPSRAGSRKRRARDSAPVNRSQLLGPKCCWSVAALLPVLLLLKCLTDNDVTDVATFLRSYHYHLTPAPIGLAISVLHLAHQALLATGSLAGPNSHSTGNSEAHVRQGLEDYEKKFKDRKFNALKKTAKAMGFDLVQKQPLPSCVS